MKRRFFLKESVFAVAGLTFLRDKLLAALNFESTGNARVLLDVTLEDWRERWEKSILSEDQDRYCDHEVGEEVGWLISPFLNAFYWGYQATHDPKWVALLTDWSDSWLKRGVKEPDGYIGWPKIGTGGTMEENFLTDSLLGEAMGFRPIVSMAGEIRRTPALKEKYGARAEAWLQFSCQTFEKWNSRGCWREVKDGGLWVVPDFGIDAKTGGWTEGYVRRMTNGFSNPDNKQNQIARWLLAMHDATRTPVYRERAAKWFQLMKCRMKTREGGKYFVWNYWEPAGPWDYKPDGTLRNWVGVHPNGGYYADDLEGIVAAFEHRLIFTPDDIQRLIATNRDFMWNQQINGAKFQRIDGGKPDPRWKNSPGVLWVALAPHDETLRKIFLMNNDPGYFGSMAVTPRFLAREATGYSSKI